MKINRGGKSPTSFNLPPELLQRLRVACARKGLKLTPVVAATLTDWVERVEAGQDGPASNVIPFPDPFAGLSDDDVWLVHQLLGILRDRPQGDIFGVLQATLTKAARTYVTRKGNTPNSPGAPPHKLHDEPPSNQLQSGVTQIAVSEADVPWIHKLLKVLHSKKPKLPHSLMNNMDEFVWVDEAWDELTRQNSPLVSAEAASGRGAAAPPPALPGDPHDRGPRAPGAGSDPGLAERIDAVEEAQRHRQGRTSRPARKSRSGS